MSTSLPSHRLLNKHFWAALIGLFVISLILIAGYSNRKAVEKVRTVAHLPAFGGYTDNTAFGHIVDALYRPNIHPITARNFTDETGEVFRLDGEPYYTESLGKRVLILDADTRPMTDDGQLLSKGGMKWPNPEPMAAGMLSHYLYARIHGYDYQFVRTNQISNWSPTWSKVPEIKNALMTHDFVVFLDQDALFRYSALPLEWLLNHWQHNKDTHLMLADEPEKAFNRDPQGMLYFNTGFIIAQNSTRTHEIIDAWLDCPKGGKYTDCKRFAYDWPHEQAALVGFVKQKEFTLPNDIRSVPCGEANGSPWTAEEHGCRGALVRHLWVNGKTHQPEELVDQVTKYFMPALYNDFRTAYDKAAVTV